MSSTFPKPLIVAHRGLHAEHPENSIEAFRAARDAGADWIECDVQASADGEPVIIHDDTLDRTARAAGPVVALTSAELARTELRGHPGSRQTCHIPLLRNVAPAAKMIVEIKPPDDAALVRRVMDLRGDGAWMIQSFDQSNLLHAMYRGAKAPVAFLVEDREVLDRAIARGWRNIHLCQDLYDEPTARRMRDRGIAAGVWTVNLEQDLRRVMGLGPAMIITDEPLLAMRLRAEP